MLFKTRWVLFTQGTVVNIFIIYQLDIWSRDFNTNFKVRDCLLEAVKLTKNADPDKYFHSGYGTVLDLNSTFWCQTLILVKILLFLV